MTAAMTAAFLFVVTWGVTGLGLASLAALERRSRSRARLDRPELAPPRALWGGGPEHPPSRAATARALAGFARLVRRRTTVQDHRRGLGRLSRALGCGAWAVLRRVTTPLLWRGVVAAMAFVFLATVKELPLTLILSPTGFDTLATNVWNNTEEAMFAEAAPNALAIIAVAGVFLTALIVREEK